ncbi:type II toxin-antitoxin system RelE/ParE family toxin [Nostoc sp. CHAB 5784]|uniref:type II toxin-antitoxin system RelE/ParE family toxin n=1 Tax=Nostoc mirabile TaxID=2907820 RepID=UPI001E2A8D72|nr:type II toxin-antitoxin system RelE/ParE family toxin [Nostoc mirabile]MCC5664263.1 type II toxin-antitoxin system RelE/ParE family toxin [Nostoc mirabile CHAB5784]
MGNTKVQPNLQIFKTYAVLGCDRIVTGCKPIISSFDAAEPLLKKINEKCSNLANFPNMGRKRNELLPLLRSFAVDDYLIFYRAMSPTGYAYAGIRLNDIPK